MDPRIDFFENLVKDKSSRILEFGPLNRPIANKENYPNSYTCDIRTTEEVRELYSGNDYLKATGITIDPETIVPIDYVAKGSYTESLKGVDRFDYVIASHVLEHVDNLIFALQDIGNLLKPHGVFFVVYPDKRYCFDHFRTSASFRDAYRVFRKGVQENDTMVLDFFYSVISENNPTVFWNNENLIEKHLPTTDFQYALDHYEKASHGIKMDDVHYWPFTDMDFLRFLYDCTRARLLPYRCIAFQPCLRNDQQFMLALEYDPSVPDAPESAELLLAGWMKKALPDYYTSESADATDQKLTMLKELSEYRVQAETLRGSVELIQLQKVQLEEQIHGILQKLDAAGLQNAQLVEQAQELSRELDADKLQNAQFIEENHRLLQKLDRVTEQYNIIESSRCWRMTAPLRKVLDVIKRILR